jgi:eukaryotic-like serine/threonine-protein kinase
LWRFATGDRMYAAPSVAQGVVFVGGDDKRLYAVGAQTGEVIWVHSCPDDITTSPVVVDGLAYVGVRDNSLYAIAAADS